MKSADFPKKELILMCDSLIVHEQWRDILVFHLLTPGDLYQPGCSYSMLQQTSTSYSFYNVITEAFVAISCQTQKSRRLVNLIPLRTSFWADVHNWKNVFGDQEFCITQLESSCWCCVNYFAFPMKLERELKVVVFLVAIKVLQISRRQKWNLFMKTLFFAFRLKPGSVA